MLLIIRLKWRKKSAIFFSFLAFQRIENNLDFILIQFCVIIIPTLIFSLPGLIVAPPPHRWLAGPALSPRSSASSLVGGGLEWSAAENVPQEAAGGDSTAGLAAPPPLLLLEHAAYPSSRGGLALSRSPASVGEWGWCCFAAPGRKNAWERKKVRRHGGGAGRWRRVCAVLRLSRCATFTLTILWLFNQVLLIPGTDKYFFISLGWATVSRFSLCVISAIMFKWQRSSSSSSDSPPSSHPMWLEFITHNK